MRPAPLVAPPALHSGAGASELDARRALAEAALDRLGELTGRDGIRDELEGSLRQLYESRIERLETHREGSDITLEDWERARRALLAAERDELRRGERDGTIGFSAARRIERELDYQESGLRG